MKDHAADFNKEKDNVDFLVKNDAADIDKQRIMLHSLASKMLLILTNILEKV